VRTSVIVREVGLRDGLQLVPMFLGTAQKIEWCCADARAGVREIEVTSFVPEKIVPQFADAVAVAEAAKAIGGLTVAALVPNFKGAARAMDCGVDKANYVLSASEEHNRANVRRTTEESIADFERIVAERNARGVGTKIVGGIATTFGCTLQGEVPAARVYEIAERLAAGGADELVVADTVGYANPAQVRRILGRLTEIFKGPIYAHFHDTRGLGLANIVAAVDAGITRFDASLGGLGGCPFAPGASGNIDMEDCVFLLESMGFDTGIDIDALIALRAEVQTWLPNERLVGSVAKADLPKTYKPKQPQAA